MKADNFDRLFPRTKLVLVKKRVEHGPDQWYFMDRYGQQFYTEWDYDKELKETYLTVSIGKINFYGANIKELKESVSNTFHVVNW